MTSNQLAAHPIHLGLGATAIVQPEFTGDPQWYEAYARANQADGSEGRLVTVHTFSQSWSMWEMHPRGSEVVYCIAGQITLHQEQTAGEITVVVLEPGCYAINPPGIWHTADVSTESTVLFVTAGMGTEHRPRAA